MNNIDMETLAEKINRRRAFKKMGLGALGIAALGAASADAQVSTNSMTNGITYPRLSIAADDQAILDFALNLEYLEANFYSYATTGLGIEARGVAVAGRGKQGTVTAPPSPQVTFNNPTVQAYAQEIAADEIAHVNFLRGVCLASGHKPVAQPQIDLFSSFNTAAAAAGLGSSFSPFTSSPNDLDFLLGAFLFEDVGVTAYHGAIASIINKTTLTSAAGILGTEAYHASLVRTQIYGLGSAAIAAAQAISTARNELGGEGLDQGVLINGLANIDPADANAIVFARTSRLVLNIVYLGVNAKKGGFFPEGMNS